MFTKEKRKNIQYEALSDLYDKPVKLIEKISKLIHIRLRKSEIGLGFTLGSEEAVDKEESYTYVRKILDFSPAKYDGRLQVGDRILMINNLDVGSMFQTDIVRMIRSLPIGEIINITVSRTVMVDEEIDHVISVPHSSNCQMQPNLSLSNDAKMEIFHFIITITNDIGKISHCQASAGVLGISVECRATEINSSSSTPHDTTLCNHVKINTSTDIQKKFFVKSILRNGSAYQDGRLKISDEILAVQGIDVQNGNTYIIDPHFDIYGDIFHFDLATVFLKNLEKLNKLPEFREMFEMNSENPLYALKSLIKEAGDMYSSISIVVRRAVSFISKRGTADNDLIKKTYKNNKKKINELCRIENIFELNPDYRHNYGDNRTRESRYKEEEFNEIHGRFHHERFIHHRISDHFDDESVIGRSLENFYVDEYEYDKSLMESNSAGKEELYSYFSKDEEYVENDDPNNNNNDRAEPYEEYPCNVLEDVDKNIDDFSTSQE